MKTPLVIGLLLALAGWTMGRHLGSLTADATTRSAAAQVKDSGSDPAAERGLMGGGNPLSAVQLREVLGGLPQDSAELMKFDALFRASERLPSREFPAAMEAIQDLKRGWRGMLLDIWAEREAVAAHVWFEAQSVEDRAALFPEWATTWARVDAASMIRWLNGRSQEERALLPNWQIKHFSAVLTEADGPAALAVARSYPAMMDILEVFGAWAKRDPQAAAAKAMEESGEVRSRAINSLMRQWSVKDPKAAQAWMDELEDPALAKAARDGFLKP